MSGNKSVISLVTVLFSLFFSFTCAAQVVAYPLKTTSSKKKDASMKASMKDEIALVISGELKKQGKKEEVCGGSIFCGPGNMAPGGKFRLVHGKICSQEFRMKNWGKGGRYAYTVGSQDLSKYKNVDIVLFFHGMHSVNYARAFEPDIQAWRKKNRNRGMLFVGFMDVPGGRGDWTSRWEEFDSRYGEGPMLIVKIAKEIVEMLKATYPGKLDSTKISISIAAFSGGHRVLDSTCCLLADGKSSGPDFRWFSERLSRIMYFDTWFNPVVVETVPCILRKYPGVKHISTISMEQPRSVARQLAKKMGFADPNRRVETRQAGGKLFIKTAGSHWSAMKDELLWALSI